MKCEYCNKEVEKGYMDIIETANYKFYICDNCMIIIEDKLENIIRKGTTFERIGKGKYKLKE